MTKRRATGFYRMFQYGTGFSAMRKSPPPEGLVSNPATILKYADPRLATVIWGLVGCSTLQRTSIWRPVGESNSSYLRERRVS